MVGFTIYFIFIYYFFVEIVSWFWKSIKSFTAILNFPIMTNVRMKIFVIVSLSNTYHTGFPFIDHEPDFQVVYINIIFPYSIYLYGYFLIQTQ